MSIDLTLINHLSAKRLHGRSPFTLSWHCQKTQTKIDDLKDMLASIDENGECYVGERDAVVALLSQIEQ